MGTFREMTDGTKFVLSILVAMIVATIVYILTRLHHPGYL